MNQDPTGVFETARKGMAQAFEAARVAALPSNTKDPGKLTADRDSRAFTLEAQIQRDSVHCRWDGIGFSATIQDGQSMLTLEPGGNVPEGSITLVTGKARFKGNYPSPDGEETELEIQSTKKNVWIKFNITAVVGQHDITDDQLTITAELIPADE